MRVTHDRARQFGKAYVGALNTGREEFAAMFAPGARVRVDGRETDPDGVRDSTPPGRSAYRGARVEPPQMVVTVRVRDRARERVDDHEHRVVLDEAGRIAALDARLAP